jgi:hypothetical protein
VHGKYQLPTPRAQWHAAAAGPAVSLAAAGISVAAAAELSALGAGQLTVLVFAVDAWINPVLGVVSLLTGAGLDGGRIIRAVAWARTGDPVRGGSPRPGPGGSPGPPSPPPGWWRWRSGYVGGLGLGLIGFLMITTPVVDWRLAHASAPERFRRSENLEMITLKVTENPLLLRCRRWEVSPVLLDLVVRGGVEPPTFRFSVVRPVSGDQLVRGVDIVPFIAWS